MVQGFKGLGVKSWNWIRDNKDFSEDGTPRDHFANRQGEGVVAFAKLCAELEAFEILRRRTRFVTC